MKLKWDDMAKAAVLETARSIQRHFGARSCKELLGEIRRTERLLRQNPNLGPKEPLLEDATVEYRSIVVNRLNKLVYWINGDVIEVVDFWELRRNPEALAAQVK